MAGETSARLPHRRAARRRRDVHILEQTLGELATAAGQCARPSERPWRLRARSGGLELLTERTSRASVLAGGAALLNLRLAIASAGREPVVAVAPDDAPDVLVRVEAGPWLRDPPSDGYLYGELLRRREGAPRLTAPVVPHGVMDILSAAVEPEGARLVPYGAGWSVDQAHAHALLVTVGNGFLDWLRAGQAMQRLLLTAGTAWLEVRCDTGGSGVAGVPERVRRDLCPGGVPQVILELGQRTAPVS